MAFDKINKVSEQELTPELQEKINSKCSNDNFLNHKNNTDFHITPEERNAWNSSLKDAKVYTDTLVAQVVGNGVSETTNLTDLLDRKVNSVDFNSFKATLAGVAFSGSYNDLLDKPSSVAYSQDANHAFAADRATTADKATTASNADYATNAGNSATVGGVRITIGANPPSSPINDKEIWIDTANQAFKYYHGNAWLKTTAVWS